LAYRNQNLFPKKEKFGKFSKDSEKFPEVREKSETGGKCIIAFGGGWTPL